MTDTSLVVPLERIERRIHFFRGHKAMLDSDLAELYDVRTKNLNKAVSRNKDRFPEDFMFQLTEVETSNLRFQFGTSKEPGRGGRRYLPYAFTEQGVAMLSSVLRSQRAIQANVAIMRAFVKLRQMLSANKELAKKLDELERKVTGHDADIESIFASIRDLMDRPDMPRPAFPRQAGFKSTTSGQII